MVEQLYGAETREHPRISFEQFREAVNSTFGNDLSLVHSTDTPKTSPWNEPHPTGTYSLVEIPDVTEEEFVKKMEAVTDVAITCMDKHCAHNTWQELSVDAQGGVAMFTWGGGVVQHGEARVEALKTVGAYFAQLKLEGRLPNLQTIHADDHDSICGAVKYFLNGTDLPSALSELYNREITSHSVEEDEISAELIRDGARLLQHVFRGTGVNVVAELHYIDRSNPADSKLESISLEPTEPRRNIQSLLADLKRVRGHRA